MFRLRLNKLVLCSLLFIFCFTPRIYAEDTPLSSLIERTASFFKPLSGDVISVDEGRVKIGVGSKDGVLKGMRLRIFRQGEYFYHPVTREPLGRIEKPVGRLEVLQVKDDSASGKIIEGEAKSGDLVRIPSSKKRLLFYQGESVDYYLGDAYYRGLMATGRFEIVDAPIEQIDTERLLTLAASKKTEVVLVLSSETVNEKRYLKQRLLWTTDGAVFSEDSVEIPTEFLKELGFGSELLSGIEDEPLLRYDLPFGAELISTGDIDGDGKPELVMSTGTDIYVYSYDIDLGFLYQLESKADETIVWMKMFDINKDGRDEVFLTAITSDRDEVNSYIYSLDNRKFVTIWKTEGFINLIDGKILHQGYSTIEGYSGPVVRIEYNDGNFKKAGRFVGFEGVNIYDFVTFRDREGNAYYLLVDDNDYLKLLNSKGVLLWQSAEDMGGFTREYKKESPTIMVDMGSWYIKDRLTKKKNEIIVIKREPLVETAKTLGYKSSQLLAYWYNGVGMEKAVLIDKIPGELLDYSVFGNKVAVLSKPLMGIKAGNILKGENPFVTHLQIYSIKGR